MRLFRRRRDAMEIWRDELPGSSSWSPEPGFRHAPDLDPSEVDVPERVGMLGRPLPRKRSTLTGLDGGGGLPSSHHHYGH